MKKVLVVCALLLVSFGLLFAAGGNETSTTAPALDAPVDRSQQLVIYSNSASAGRADWLTQRAAKEGFNVTIVDLGGAELANRLIAEKNNSLCDLVYGLNSLEYEKLKKEGLLLKYTPVWANEVDKALGDPEGYYHPIVVQPLVLMYKSDLADAPKDWTDLTDPKYKGAYNIFRLTGGTAKTILSSILVRYADPKGEYGISAEGWEVARKYIQNAYVENGQDYIGELISGVRPMSMMWGSGVIQNQQQRNYKFGIMSPAIGVPYVVEQVCIISKTKKAALALDFANWFGSKELQAEWSAKFGSIPAQPAALAQASDDIKAFMGKIHPQTIDWALVAANVDKWVEKVELEFMK